MPHQRRTLILTLSLAFLWASAQCGHAAEVKKIVLIAGKKSHGPVGNRIHDYPWSVKLLKVMLDNSNIRDQVRVETHFAGWPAKPETLNDADTIVVISDGRDGDKYAEAPHLASPANVALVQRQIERGCGFVTFHFSTFAPDQYASQILDWSGGYFDWETDGRREWYSAIKTLDASVAIATAEHPVARGVKPFKMKEEFYYNIRFAENDDTVRPIWSVADLPGRDARGRVVAWAKERPGGGRGFGTTCGHFYDNWRHESFRRTMLNAVAWTAGVELPAAGVRARFYSHEEITLALANRDTRGSAVADVRPIRVLMFAGNEAHKWHNWQKTSAAIDQLLKQDPRINVELTTDIEDLKKKDLDQVDVIVLNNYANWHDPTPLSETSKQSLTSYLGRGGGLVSIHFANGAWHFSLPMAGQSDWPEFRKIIRRVWNHRGDAARSGHDAFGKFTVTPTAAQSEITAGLKPFEVTDELYFRQHGDQPVTPLITARSKVTGRDEPLAFAYRYKQARVFQTLLGHSEQTYDTFEPREMVRRAVAWTAGRTPLVMEPARDAAPKQAAAGPPLVPGRFASGLNVSAASASVKGNAAFRQPPITVECWARLSQKKTYNILVANETKASATHWEMFSVAGSGLFTVYMPGMQPDHVRTNVDICNGEWRHLAMIYEPRRVRLFVDGKQAADERIERQGDKSIAGGLAIGALVSRQLHAEGVIDEVRVSRGERRIEAIPSRPLEADAATLALWRFDGLSGSTVENHGALKDAAGQLVSRAGATQAAAKPAAEDHYSRNVIGFDWTEDDSKDGRWNQTEVGRHLASILQPPGKVVRKGLSLKLGDNQRAAVCFDTERLQYRTLWTDGFLKFDPARFGVIRAPQIAGTPQWISAAGGGWAHERTEYVGMRVRGSRVVLEQEVDGVAVRESPWFTAGESGWRFTRQLDISPGPALTMNCFHGEREWRIGERAAYSIATSPNGQEKQLTFAVKAGAGRWRANGGRLQLVFPARNRSTHTVLQNWIAPAADETSFIAAAEAMQVESLDALSKPGPRRWPRDLKTTGKLGQTPGAYVVDTLTLPFANHLKALFFVTGHDFFSNGDAAICTVHGDVWRVSGIDRDLDELTYRRYATGLFQPLGLRIIADRVYVLGRDQITRLHDENADGEADFYESFCNAYQTSPGGHDYVACLETDSVGNFYFVHAKQGVVKVSADGSKATSIATGFRNPNGLGVGPGDVITVAPQEGEWTPVSNIAVIRQGGYYGYGGPRVSVDRPLGYDPPLCWIPRRQDNSSGGQVWVTSDRWGPLRDKLLHLSFGQCRLLLVLDEKIDGHWQGGTVSMSPVFESGAARGRFSPRDGQLYVTGLNGWVTSAARDGCFQRVRYTGGQVGLPNDVRTLKNGVMLRFAAPLDRKSAENPDNFHVEQWNYRYSGSYGSDDYRPSNRAQVGRDAVDVLSATLLDDSTLFLEMPRVQPVDQMAIHYNINAADGSPLRNSFYHTIHRVRDEVMPPEKLTRRPQPGRLAADVRDRLRPGLAVRYVGRSAQQTDLQVRRLAALAVTPGAAATAWISPGKFRADFDGYLHVDLRQTVQFRFAGRGLAALTVNGAEVLSVQGQFDRDAQASTPLNKGFNRIQVHYQSEPNGGGRLRLLWSSPTFADELVPATSLWHDSGSRLLAARRQLQRGGGLIESRGCAQCHREFQRREAVGRNEMAGGFGPDLTAIAERLNPAWISQWLLASETLRSARRMPHLFDRTAETDVQAASDLVAFLTSSRPRVAPARATPAQRKQGLALYEDLACIACHRLDDPQSKDRHQRISLKFVAAKYQPGALAAFLRKPHQHYEATRMPDFRLSDSETIALSAYLRSKTSAAVLDDIAQSGDPRRGEQLFQTRQCAACHRYGPEKTATRFIAVKKMARGCLANEPDKTVPRFGLSVDDRAAIEAYTGRASRGSPHVNPVERAENLMRGYRCTACHDRDQTVAPRAELLLDESERGLPPEPLPNLTWAGEKLRSEWVRRMLAGEVKAKTRPWLRARMPTFPQLARAIAAGLPPQHGVDVEEPMVVDPRLARVGDQLSRKVGGLDCRQCHAVGADQPTGDDRTKIALGVNFALTKQRLRRDFYDRFVLDPPRYDIRTKMPRVVLDGERTALIGVFDGDARRQFDALWHFINAVETE
jgi:type 1 glutamine amidotransferase/mono/diheme cytochrome c family protein